MTKNLPAVLLALILLPAVLVSQADLVKNQQTITGGLGVTFIDGQPYYLFNLSPELSFGKLGFGLDLNLRFNKEGKFKTDDYQKARDYIRVIRYIRWGLKKDPFYIRAGNLDYSQLGHGFIMYQYRNTASYDLRKTGIELDLNFEKFGFETVYSDLAGAGILGARGYVKPVKFTSARNIPVIGGFEVGATYVVDVNSDANKTVDTTKNAVVDGGKLPIFGFDIGFPLLTLPVINSTLYADYAKISSYGSGKAVGIDMNFYGLGLLRIGAKYERRFNGDRFLPAYFNAMYERDRFIPGPTPTTFHSKAQILDTVKSSQGYFGGIIISILNSFYIIGGYYSPVGVSNQGVLHAELETPNVIPSIVLSAGYDKKNIGPLFALDENSLLHAFVGYKPIPYLVVGTLYEWTFTEDKDPITGNVIGYKTQTRIEPKVSLVLNF